jgi:magnesium chelatase family protein
MLAKLKTFSLLGIAALPVEVEVDVSPAGFAKTLLIGVDDQKHLAMLVRLEGFV